MDGGWLSSLPINFDSSKSEANRADRTRGFGFELAEAFEFDTAFIEVDDRRDYGEVRLVALGMIGARVHVMVFTIRSDTLWIISLQKANSRERKRYGQYVDGKAGGRNYPPVTPTH